MLEADMFSPRPEIMSAGYGFKGIIGVEGGEAEVRAAGGTWNSVTCTSGDAPPRRVLTSSVEPGRQLTVERADAMPTAPRSAWSVWPT